MRVNQTAGNLIELFSNGPFVSQMSSVVSAFSVPIDSVVKGEGHTADKVTREKKRFLSLGRSEYNERPENIFFQKKWLSEMLKDALKCWKRILFFPFPWCYRFMDSDVVFGNAMHAKLILNDSLTAFQPLHAENGKLCVCVL